MSVGKIKTEADLRRWLGQQGVIGAGSKTSLDKDLAALAKLTGTGFPARTSANHWTLRSITEGKGIHVTFGVGTSGDPTIQTNAVGGRFSHSTNQSIPDTTQTLLNFDTERFDTDAFHSNTVANTKITIPFDGVYTVSAGIEWAGNATGRRRVALQLNAGSFIASQSDQALADATAHRQTVTTTWSFVAGDFVQVSVVQTSGGNLNVTNAPDYSPEFSIVYGGTI